MVNCLVVQKRVCFGSPEFMFLRRDINIMLNQRDRLKCGHKLKYEENKERVDFLQNTIRALAGLVYFKTGSRKFQRQEQVMNTSSSETYEEYKKRKRAEKESEKKSKGKKSRKIVDNRQQVLPI